MSRGRSWGVLLFWLLCATLSGCATLPGPTKVDPSFVPRPGIKVAVGTISNETGETFDVNVVSMLRNAMTAALHDEELQVSEGEPDLILTLQIIEYRPGNAFKRWLLPNWGSTVLGVQGDLRGAHNRSLVASVNHQHSISFGGAYTIGAWETIFKVVANAIARDLKIKLEPQGGTEQPKDFVVSLPPRAERTRSAVAPASPITTKIVAIIDRRTETKRIGERQAAFGVPMGDVYFHRDVPEFLRQALADELRAMGHSIVESNEIFTVTGVIDKFWIHTDTTMLYWDIISDIRIKLSIERPATKRARIEREYSCTKTDRTYIWPTSILFGNILSECLDELMTKIRSDPVWSLKGF